MADDRTESRDIDFKQWLPWTQLFRGFWLALDHKKLLLAAGGILVMAVGWWLLAVIFFNARTKPDLATQSRYSTENFAGEGDAKDAQNRAWKAFKEDRNSWNLLYKAAGAPSGAEMFDAADLADTREEYDRIVDKFKEALAGDSDIVVHEGRRFARIAGKEYPLERKPAGQLRTWPWFEDRGPNPYLLVTGSAGRPGAADEARHVPWDRGQFFDWFMTAQVPFLLEPLFKLLRPVVFFVHPHAQFLDRLYFFLVLVWTVATWAIFGGAITRIAAVEIARDDKIGLMEAVRYALTRRKSYLFASFAPILGLAVLAVLLMIFGALSWTYILSEFIFGLLWFLALLAGLAMAVLFVGFVGWPMIHATLSAEGSDSFDALTRSYSYVLQRPWSYLWYAFVMLCYGAVVVFFVGFMGSLMVYMAKWGVTSPIVKGTSRDPSYMFVYAPTSFGWQELLLRGSPVVEGSEFSYEKVQKYVQNEMRPWNYIGATLVSCWLYLIFLMIIGFGYSYFWSQSTMIYFMMRQKVDDVEIDEVYLEEEEADEPYSIPATQTPSAPAGSEVQMIDAPVLRPSGSGSAATTAAPPASATDGPKAEGQTS